MTSIDELNRQRAERHRLVDAEYHKKCHDCGQFVPRDRWVKKDDPRKAHALCSPCYSNYDDPAFM
jgi:formylmethanofuran dehydrogenase subunit E